MLHYPPARVSRRAVLGAALALPAAVAGAACGGDPQPQAPSSPRHVRVLTGAGFQPWEAYLYLAQARVWWADAGLEVEVLPGQGTGRNLALLIEGQAELAALDPAAAFIEWERGTTEFVLACQLHSNLLASVMAAESTGIRRLADLEGRRVAVLPGGTNTQLFPGLARVAGLDADAVELVPLELPFFPHMAAGTVDASLEFIPSRYVVERAVGEPVVVLPYADDMPELPGLALGITRETANEQPDMVRAFSEVAIRAIQQSVEQPEEAAQAMADAHEDVDPEVVAASLRDLEPYIRPDELGTLDEVRCSQTVALLHTLGLLGDNPQVSSNLGEILATDLA